MNKLTKIMIGVFAFVLVALGVALYIVASENKKLSQKEPEKVTEQSIRAEVVKKFIDSAGKQHTTFSTGNPFTKKEIRDGVVNKPLLDTISRALDIKSAQVVSYMRISQTSEARALKAERTVDSLKRVVYRYKNQYISVAYRQADATDTVNPSGTFDYKYSADIKVTQYTKRKKFLGLPIGSNANYIDISSTDPNATVNGLSTFTVKQNTPSFGLRVQGLTSYNFGTSTISPGLGIQFDFKRWSATGAYYYNPGVDKIRPTVGLRYDLVRF